MNIKITPQHLEILKELAHEVWGSYDDTHGYRTEKQEINAKVSTDHPDNIWFFWNQFDSENHENLYNKLLSYADCPEKRDLIAWCLVRLVDEQHATAELAEQGIFV